ncbi:high-affinity choline transporter BetT [Corynebacterium yudongzhengii]|uniref:High-affinity choline transporter BetT n=1 Tax=Corynebacterium yudongzhengii TaxID=2080740 RepID=A0A2U1T722_9CORY|nr:choline BCCT transporter BetT [Corynebacterium yudongzhengii]AWB81368.1 high-affinity choline transporter BetT [Corynebacterium yudongzhengii]PWC01811.1 high-affinity choline transporter BetT [Corynebacterium yudongzhengii]
MSASASHSASADTETQPEPQKKKRYSAVHKPVFFISAAMLTAFVIWAWLAPEQAETVIFGSMDWIATNLGWYYVLTAAVIVVFVVVIALSSSGHIKLGPDHSKPRYSLFTWASMLFAAGIGVDLMFFSISGPATNFLTPPDVEPLSDEAARMAAVWTMFHYGIPGWAMYALMGTALGLFAYRYHLPLSIRSALAPILGRRIKGAAGDAVDIAALIGTIFGISVSLGIGVVFINYGLSHIFDIPTNQTVQVALIAVSVFVTILSTVSGVDKGIRRLSELNVLLAIGLMAWVLITGRFAELMYGLVQNIGDFLTRLPTMLFETFIYTDGAADYPADQWLADWTLFFWAWWIAWAPFVGLFLTRISRGRTLREFILGVLFIPPMFIVLFVSIFGNAALMEFRDGNDAFLNEAVELPESGYFNLLAEYPGATFLIAIAIIVALLFYITSADSGSLVMANMSSHTTLEDSDGSPILRIVWAVLTGALTLVMLFIDGVYTTQAATVLIGLPFSLVMYGLIYSVYKALRAERRSLASQEAAFVTALGEQPYSAGSNWKDRLTRRMSFPTQEKAFDFLRTTATPAVAAVADQLDDLGVDIRYSSGETADENLPFVNLSARFPEQEEFKYELYPVAHPMPSYAPRTDAGRDQYYTVEVFNARGTRGHNLMGCSKDQVIADVLNAYESHMQLMQRGGAAGSSITGLDTEAPNDWADAGTLQGGNPEEERTDN